MVADDVEEVAARRRRVEALAMQAEGGDTVPRGLEHAPHGSARGGRYVAGKRGRAMLAPMDDVGLGRRYRALRHRLGWRQRDVGERRGVSQDLVSLVECGHIEDVSVRALRRHARALGAELRLELWFRGPELERLMDEGHAAIVGAVARRLEALGWETRPEVSFAVFAERGSIDLVGWHAATGTLLVIEVKTELVSIEETLRRHDAKVRLAPQVRRQAVRLAGAARGPAPGPAR